MSEKAATVLGCVHCDFKCCSTNQFCRHIFASRHGAVKCPVCETYIVARAFYTSLKKLISKAAQGSDQEVFEIDTVTHAHLAACPPIQTFERNDFVLPGNPSDYNLSVASTTAPPGDRQFRCMLCLVVLPTWTQVTKHFDTTRHTLPNCIDCDASLKCYGPQRPGKHEATTGHRGFFGIFYTRDDYDIAFQNNLTCYSADNLYTGLCRLQYRCVCGVSFLEPLHLAEHLHNTHHATAVDDAARCCHCGARATLRDMVLHVRSCAEGDAAGAGAGAGAGGDGITSPAAEVGLNLDMFLVHRPLFAPSSQHVLPGLRRSSFAVFYQCPECYLLFSTWEAVLAHLRLSGHCVSYCAVCRMALPPPTRLSGGGGGTDWSYNIESHLQHLRAHPHILQLPALPDRLEVLVDLNDPAIAGLLDVPEHTGPREQVVFQCPDGQRSGCTQVFGFYGELCRHLATTGHAAADTTVPFIDCKVTFTPRELCDHFGFAMCSYCDSAFAPQNLNLHAALCISRLNQAPPSSP